jgi:putative ABC transport system ATP-binding protein
MSAPGTWFVRRGGKSEGPLTVAELKEQAGRGLIAADTPLSPDGREWVRARDVAGLLGEGRPALEMVGVAKGFVAGAAPVVEVESFTVRAGEQLVLAGPSGSGKTTMLHLMAGLLEPDRGVIRVDGTDLTALSGAARDRFRGNKIGIVFQTFNLVQGLSAENNVMLALMFGDLPRAEHAARARELLTRVGLDEHRHKRPSELSVGQQQRVGIARALANRPTLVLADEPAANLDAANAEKAVKLLKDVCAEGGHTLVVVAHDDLVLRAFDKVIRIDQFKPKEGTASR